METITFIKIGIGFVVYCIGANYIISKIYGDDCIKSEKPLDFVDTYNAGKCEHYDRVHGWNHRWKVVGKALSGNTHRVCCKCGKRISRG